MTDHEPLTKDKIELWIVSNGVRADILYDLLSALQGLQNQMLMAAGFEFDERNEQAYQAWQRAEEELQKWFPLLDSHSQPSGKTTVPVPVGGGAVGGDRVGGAGELSHPCTRESVREGAQDVEHAPRKGTAAEEIARWAGEMSRLAKKPGRILDVEHASRKGYKYASCTAPIGERCSKHGAVHRKNKDEEVGRTHD